MSARPTQCERLLAALSDGRWHDHHQLYQLHMVVHSRVAELRKRGHRIEQRRDGDLYLYRLALGEATDHDAGSLPRLTDGSVASPNALTERDKAPIRPAENEPIHRGSGCPGSTTPPRSVSASGEPQPDPATGGTSPSNPLRATGLRHKHGPHLTGCGSPDAHQQLVIGEAA